MNLVKLAKWTLFYVLQWAVLYAAFWLRIDGALHIVTFWVCVFALGAPLLVLDVATTLAVKEPPRPVREHLTTLVHWATLALLVWNGHIAFAVIWAMAMFCIAIHRSQVQAARKAARVAPA